MTFWQWALAVGIGYVAGVVSVVVGLCVASFACFDKDLDGY